MSAILQTFINQSILSLEYIKQNGAEELIFDIDCGDLEEFLSNNIMYSDKFKPLFDKLSLIKGPVIYWFTIESDISGQELIFRLKEYRENVGGRLIPYIKPNPPFDTKCLYVGKVKRAFYGRIIQHFGCYSTPNTQGLQLYYWAKKLSLKLSLHAIEFNKDMEDMMPCVEQFFANELHPLIGKHS